MTSIAREAIPVAARHDIYPEIDPEEHFKGQTYRGKVVIITGASRGIGEQMALMYAQAGAHVVIASRKQETLDSVRKRILELVPTAEVLTVPTDVAIVEQVETLVAAAITRYGRLDVVIANAGTTPEFKDLLGDEDPFACWGVIETNLRGTYNTARFSLSHLAKTKGSFVAITSGAASMRFPTMSSYGISKFAINRLVEFIHLEYPDVLTFALHPGVVDTEMGRKQSAYAMDDSPQLPAATTIYLTSGKADYLSGRYIAADWDLGEIYRDWKEKITKEDALVNRLTVPT
ncbi:hypothetical protein EWM64_g7568 [Hericium alpestre]|uniref:NAD(P)-binding protein n=1 Tax=Hericium alpestre TaxID=135208 RepID=A0A4Y9ZQA6_9AGAM|nr:hypothetical protein EWM64_g7568 [Hericium alpestre]